MSRSSPPDTDNDTVKLPTTSRRVAMDHNALQRRGGSSPELPVPPVPSLGRGDIDHNKLHQTVAGFSPKIPILRLLTTPEPEHRLSVPPAGVPVALLPAPVVPSSYHHRSSPPKLDPIHMGAVGHPPLHHTHSGSIGNASAISPSHSHSQQQPPPSATSIVHSPFELRYSQLPPQTWVRAKL